MTTDYSPLVNKFLIVPDQLLTFNFDVLQIDDLFILQNIVCCIFKTFLEKTGEAIKLSPMALKAFVADVCDHYRPVAYHNFYHAVHILHTAYLLVDRCDLFRSFHPHVLFGLLVSALTHDIGHPGTNNAFEINTGSDLAFRYNDLSVLEQFHCYTAFELIKKHQLFEQFTCYEYVVCRKTIIECILGTDMANHRQILDWLRQKQVFDSIDDQYGLAKVIVHAADIGNPIQSYELCETWAKKIAREFHSQIEQEKERGLKPFTSFDITSGLSFYQHEIKYIEYVCKPFWDVVAERFPALTELRDRIGTNCALYQVRVAELELEADDNWANFSL